MLDCLNSTPFPPLLLTDAGQPDQFNAPWQCLYLLPDPQGQGALRLICRSA